MKEKDLSRIREEIADSNDLIERYQLRESIDERRAWDLFLEKFHTTFKTQKIDDKKWETTVSSEENKQSYSRFRIFHGHSTLLRIAAVVLLLIAGGAFWYHRDYTRVTPPKISEDVQIAMRQSKEAGRNDADVVIISAGHSMPITQEEKILYHVDDDFAQQLADAKRITTYKEKEFWVTLEDGTLVHLNYNSRLIYPEKFGDRRDVILEGEAYFMVAKDKSRHFVVHTPQGDVKVYGTEFNVNTRKDDDAVSVVLVSGSVSFISSNGREMMMQPGQELSCVKSQFFVTSIDTAPYVAWNEGKFSFQAWPLERVMTVLARWYGYQVKFIDDDIRQKSIDGCFSRYNDIQSTLKGLESALGVNFMIVNQTIIINQ